MCSKPKSWIKSYKTLIIIDNICELTEHQKHDHRFTAKSYKSSSILGKVERIIWHYITRVFLIFDNMRWVSSELCGI